MKTAIVIPHHLPTLDFLNEWKNEFTAPDIEVIILNDRPENKLTVWPKWEGSGHITIYSHKDIDKELGSNSWIIPRGTSAIRSYGLYKAWQTKAERIITLDNDCFPDRQKEYFVSGHTQKLRGYTTLDWVNSTPRGFFSTSQEEDTQRLLPRGFPYGVRNTSKVYVNHGLWSNIPDLDAAGMLLYPKLRTHPLQLDESITIPRYNFYPMCGMNLAFLPEVTPLMYFGLFGKEYGFDQFDDIWAGVFSKKVMDHLGWAVCSGYPSVEHRKQSNAFVNFQKQAGGIAWNEEIWQAVQAVELTTTTPIRAYQELLQKVKLPNDEYFAKMKKATALWLELFQ